MGDRTYRTGRSVGITLYKDDRCIGSCINATEAERLTGHANNGLRFSCPHVVTEGTTSHCALAAATTKAAFDKLTGTEAELYAARQVIRRLLDGWRPGKNMAVVEAGSPRPDSVPVWMPPTLRQDSEPMTDDQRAVLDAVRSDG